MPIFLMFFILLPNFALAADSSSYTPVAVTVKSPIPIGTIMAWPTNSMPADGTWAECNGSNGTPDLRGKFIRGLGGNSGSLGSTQAEETKAHKHIIPKHSHTVSGTASAQTVSVGGQNVTGTAAGQSYMDAMTGVYPGGGTSSWYSADTGTMYGASSRDTSRMTSSSSISGTTDYKTFTTAGGNITGVTSLAGNDTNDAGGLETRPVNVALKYIMKIR